MKLRLLLVLLSVALLAGCWMDLGDDDDDDDDNDGPALDCNATDCDNIGSLDDCEQYEDDADVYQACIYCLGTMTERQIGQCMLDYRHDASGTDLEQACAEQVEQECSIEH